MKGTSVCLYTCSKLRMKQSSDLALSSFGSIRSLGSLRSLGSQAFLSTSASLAKTAAPIKGVIEKEEEENN